MKIILVAAAAAVLATPALAAPVKHFPALGPAPAGATSAAAPAPPFSKSVLAGDTLYISGATDRNPSTGQPGADAEEGAKLVLDALKAGTEQAGMTMDDLVWVQIFCSDLTYYAKFNEVYRTYFKGPLPARAFLGVDHLLGGAHFEAMGIAVKPTK